MNYNGKKFKAIQNSENGEISEETIFEYKQIGNVLSAVYSGGNIIQGHLIGLVDQDGNIEMRYHQINLENILMTGICQSSPKILSNGKIRLHETWKWTSGDLSTGSSTIEEI